MKKRTIYRTCKMKNQFTRIDNRIINDTTLSNGEFRILAHLLSKPDDWKINVHAISKQTKICDKTVKKYLNKLIKYGCIHRKQMFTEDGKFAGYDYMVFEMPDLNTQFAGNNEIPTKPHKITHSVITRKRNITPLTNTNKDTYTHSISPSPFSIENKEDIYSVSGETTDIYFQIFESWNSKKKLIRCRSISSVRKCIKSALKFYDVGDILKSISNYAEILSVEKYYFTYKYSLRDFLGKGVEKFSDEASPFENYEIRYMKSKEELEDEKYERLVEERDRRTDEQREREYLMNEGFDAVYKIPDCKVSRVTDFEEGV